MQIVIFLILLVLLFGAPAVLLGGAAFAGGFAYLVNDMLHNPTMWWFLGAGVVLGLLKLIPRSGKLL